MTTLKIKVTKEILQKSKYCSSDTCIVIENCAIALAVRDIFPQAKVYGDGMLSFGGGMGNTDMPEIAMNFIEDFDRCNPMERVRMPEIEFEIEIPDEVLQKINIDELRPLLENHPTLELVN